MAFAALKKKAHALLDQAPFISHINNDEEHRLALALMDELIDDYDYNRYLIEILSVSIERWEDESKSFSEFNAAIDDMPASSTVLKVIMDQHHLGVADFPEIGSGSLVSKIVNNQRRLTLDHIRALSKRFGIDPGLFF
ncbi:MAG: transcriptional regulator [Gammaproteobacteria bacterium]|nr:transcriptional regulator [Gammaproteobacteria bacterium]